MIEGTGRAELVVVEIRGDKVRLGLSGPDTMTFDREEVFYAKRRDQESHAGTPAIGSGKDQDD